MYPVLSTAGLDGLVGGCFDPPGTPAQRQPLPSLLETELPALAHSLYLYGMPPCVGLDYGDLLALSPYPGGEVLSEQVGELLGGS